MPSKRSQLQDTTSHTIRQPHNHTPQCPNTQFNSHRNIHHHSTNNRTCRNTKVDITEDADVGADVAEDMEEVAVGDAPTIRDNRTIRLVRIIIKDEDSNK